MKKVYPILIEKTNSEPAYFVTIPDIDGFTQGDTFAEAIAMARDYIGIYLVENSSTPEPSDSLEATNNQILTYVDVDQAYFQNILNSKTTKVSVTIPEHLKMRAKEKKINISKVLTDALTEILQY